MTDNALTMALGAVAELKRYGAVVVTFDGTHSEARAFVPRVLDAMAAHGIVARGAASIEGADGAVTIEIPCHNDLAAHGRIPLVEREELEEHGFVVEALPSGSVRITNPSTGWSIDHTTPAAHDDGNADVASESADTTQPVARARRSPK